MFEIALAFLIGISAGIFTGLAPGIHINLVSAFLLSSIDKFNNLDPLSLVVFIVSMSITHTFVDFIPSIFLGAPEEDNFLAVLPGHKLLKEGKAHKAVIISITGALLGAVIAIILTPSFIILLPKIFNYIRSIIPFILIFVSLYLILREDKIVSGFVSFLISGIIGIAAFNLPVKEPLMPLLTGLFGISSLIVSVKQKQTIPKQEIETIKKSLPSINKLIKPVLSASLIAPLCSFLPGIGSGHAGVISSETTKTDNETFLFLIGIISTIVMSLSFVTAYVIQKTRTGSAVAIQEILGKISAFDLALILTTILVSSIFAYLISLNLSKVFTKILEKINYKILNILVIITLLIVTAVFSNWIGFIVLIISSALGIYTILSGTKRINLMGCLLIPSIIYYLTA